MNYRPESDNYQPTPTVTGPVDSVAQHLESDANTGPMAQHHTLGPQRFNASPGDHIHDGTSSLVIGTFASLRKRGFTGAVTALAQVNNWAASVGNGQLAVDLAAGTITNHGPDAIFNSMLALDLSTGGTAYARPYIRNASGSIVGVATTCRGITTDATGLKQEQASSEPLYLPSGWTTYLQTYNSDLWNDATFWNTWTLDLMGPWNYTSADTWFYA